MATEKSELIDIFADKLKGDRYTSTERYEKTIDKIYEKLKPIWIAECKDCVWLMRDDLVRQTAEILYLDDKLGGNLDPSSLSPERQNILGWKQVQSVIEKYRAIDYSLIDKDSIKAILSSIIKNNQSRDADRLKAIEMYDTLYGGESIEGINFIDDISGKKEEK